MGQKKGSFTAKFSVKTRSRGKWFVQSVVARGLIYLSGEPLGVLELGEGLPRQVFRGLIDTLDN